MYYSWEAVISPADCEEIIKKYKDLELVAGEIRATGGVNADLRCASVYQLEKSDLLNRAIISYVQEANDKLFHYSINGAEPLQFIKYEVGGKYGWHMDTHDLTELEIRKLSTTVQLSNPDDYEGGEFQIFNGKEDSLDLNISKQGSVIVFDSRDWHRLTPVTKGVRYSLVQWSQGEKFV